MRAPNKNMTTPSEIAVTVDESSGSGRVAVHRPEITLVKVPESKPASPVLPYRNFRNTTAVATLIGAAVHGAVLYSFILYLPLFFQAVMLETPFRAAVSVLPTSACTIGFSVVGVLAVEVVRRYRWGVVANCLLMTSGVGLWELWENSSSRALLYGLQVIAAVGVGTLFTILTIPMTASVQIIKLSFTQPDWHP